MAILGALTFHFVYRLHSSSGSNVLCVSRQHGNVVSRLWSVAHRALRQSATQASKRSGMILRFIFTPAVLTVSGRLFCHTAYCKADVNNNIPVETVNKNPEFKWHILWEFVKPQLFALTCAVVLAFGAAILNIQIPLMLGELVNVVARYLREHTGNYIREIRGPAFKLLGLYGIQGLLTSGYIILLSRVGERVAADMRKTLFASLLRCLFLNVAFFDANKTGQLVNRLTADIQEFKSSFKLVISQVQRKHYLFSPHLYIHPFSRVFVFIRVLCGSIVLLTSSFSLVSLNC
uniref:ATP-binding cassette sub-family B member 8, mitochondrial-like n=1 Tax=Hippocampus comes TaxID=109280 RepID=A0A3Q2YJS8_HIPCM